MNNLQSISYFYPELILTVVILGAIIYDLSINKAISGRVGWILIMGLTVVGLAIYLQKDFRITTLFSDSIVLDPFASFFKLVVILATVLVSIVSMSSGELDQYRKGEYFVLLGIILSLIHI